MRQHWPYLIIKSAIKSHFENLEYDVNFWSVNVFRSCAKTFPKECNHPVIKVDWTLPVELSNKKTLFNIYIYIYMDNSTTLSPKNYMSAKFRLTTHFYSLRFGFDHFIALCDKSWAAHHKSCHVKKRKSTLMQCFQLMSHWSVGQWRLGVKTVPAHCIRAVGAYRGTVIRLRLVTYSSGKTRKWIVEFCRKEAE